MEQDFQKASTLEMSTGIYVIVDILYVDALKV